MFDADVLDITGLEARYGGADYPCTFGLFGAVPQRGIDLTGDRLEYDAGCCVMRVGDANDSGEDEPTIGDISTLIDMLFIAADPSVVPCFAEGDIDQSGGVNPLLKDITIGDISTLIDYLFITVSR